MNTKLLIDGLVQQTTVLLAQLSTAAGIRAPLAHLADQVFVELSRAIEAEGVSRKVAADMFGLAIRTYQKKVQRITESLTARDQTLWQAVLEHVSRAGSITRRDLMSHFQRDDPTVLASVVADLLSSGLLCRTGSGDDATLRVAAERELREARGERDRESLEAIVWGTVYRAAGITGQELASALDVAEPELAEILASLVADGRVTRDTDQGRTRYAAARFLVPVSSERGWEAAVFDHFQAMVRAIAAKVRRGVPRSLPDDTIGGATLTFDVSAHHPHREEVFGMLNRVRVEANDLWNRVEQYNREQPLSDEEKLEVTFYFGQSVSSAHEE